VFHRDAPGFATNKRDIAARVRGGLVVEVDCQVCIDMRPEPDIIAACRDQRRKDRADPRRVVLEIVA
jgi:hypothetical protein